MGIFLDEVRLDKFPRANLGLWPTPLHKLSRLGERLKHNAFYIKRDDLTGLGQGGNKTRGLEFLLGDALEKGADTIVTGGGLQSNHCSLTAGACRKLGLDCYLVHNGNPPERLEGNMLVNSMFGAVSVFMGKMDARSRSVEVDKLAERLKLEGRNVYVLRNGGSTPLGMLGYANAAIELYNQSLAAGINIRHVGIVGAGGGTASGFVFGTALLGHPFHVHVIGVEHSKPAFVKIMDDLISAASGIVESVQGIKPKSPPESVATVYDEYMGEGWGVPTVQSRRAMYDLAQSEAILSEDVYTSKSLGGFMNLIKNGAIPSDEGACFIHTGGLAALFAQDVSRLWVDGRF